MSLLFSRRCEYALQAVLYVACQPHDAMTSIRELTTALDIPFHFLAKILQDLSHKGLLVSHKGPQGGFALGMPASDITLFHIIEAIDGIGFTQSCVLGFHECSDRNPCALHEKWAGLRDGIYRMLVSRNIGQLSGEMHKPGFDKFDSPPSGI
ncbi:MAG: Rrf2 family transcriptional regulator [Ignavibacteria bacterium]|nr:Rrf2 family transcriptional regulator [Ignavibacteria bacterium]